MKPRIHSWLLCLGILQSTNLSAISIVYNLRIAQATKQPIFDKDNKDHSVIVALLYDQYQKKYSGVYQNFLGGLGSFIYNFDVNYARVDFAAAQIQENINNITRFSGAEADDVLFTYGRNFAINKKSTLTLSGFLGIPTHDLFRLQRVDFGYSQVGTGLQVDGSYIVNPGGLILYAARYLYFVPRKATDNLCNNYIFSIGNIGDILFAYKNNWSQSGIELGYTLRSNFGSHSCPSLDDVTQRTNYTRSNFYFIYKYKFLINEVSNRLMFNISYGFDHGRQEFNSKYIVTLWASWNIRF
jgi:hypothetical protein